MYNIHAHDQQWVSEQIQPLPRPIAATLLKLYKKQPDRRAANTYLRESCKLIEDNLPNGFSGIRLKWSEDDLRNAAKTNSKKCFHLFHGKYPLNGIIKQHRVPLTENIEIHSVNEILALKKRCQSLGRFGESKGVTPPDAKISENQPIEIQYRRYMAFKKRMCDQNWWLHALRKAQSKKLETASHAINIVNKYAGIYASDISVNRRKDQNLRNKQLLENMQATNELGESFTLSEISDKNISNPRVRRSELMVRIRGMEDYANKSGLKGVFLTFTCPSKYHRSISSSGKPNPKWGGYTPLDGQNYLNYNWERIRTAFQRGNINPIAIRVAEPQHDGTPHWHILLFTASDRVNDAVAICRKYALEIDGNEPGADKHRFDVKEIDPAKGSATGYIAKYICKNIDGSNLEEGIYGEDPIIAAQRVDTWRSVWGIRQFQFIGGASVTVWREIRRLPANNDLPEEFEAIRAAADESNWCQFNDLMGGFHCPRKEQKVKPYYSLKFDSQTGEIKESLYGDDLIEKLMGVVFADQNIITRYHEWKIE